GVAGARAAVGAAARRARAHAVGAFVGDGTEQAVVAAGAVQRRRIVHALVGRLIAAVDRARAGIATIARRAAAGTGIADVRHRTELAVVAAVALQRNRVVHALALALVAAVRRARVGIRAIARRSGTGAVRAHVSVGAEDPVVAAGAVARRRVV